MNENKRQLAAILRLANRHYPDGMIDRYINLRTGEERGEDIAEFGGDTLALFIGREIVSVFDPGATKPENMETVERALTVAADQLHDVIAAMSHARNGRAR